MRTRITIGVTAAGLAAFALLYAPQPVLPQLAAHFRLSPGDASAAVSVATAALAIMVVPLAVLSEVVGRRPVMIGSLVLAVLAGLVLPFAPTFPLLLALRIVQGAAIAGLPATAMAYLAERLGTVGLGAAIGAMVAGNSMGGMAGRLAAGIGADAFGWRAGLGLVTALAALCAATMIFTLPGGGKPERGPVLGGIRAALREPRLLALYAVAALAMGSFVAMYNAVGFRLAAPPLSVAPGLASLIFLSYAIGGTSSALAGRIADRAGRVPIQLGGLLLAVLGALLTVPDSVITVALGIAIFTGGFFAAHSVASGWVGATAPAGARGQASGMYLCAYYLGSSVGGTAGTAVYGAMGWPTLIAVLACWLAIAGGATVYAGLRGTNTRSSTQNLSTNTGAPLSR